MFSDYRPWNVNGVIDNNHQNIEAYCHELGIHMLSNQQGRRQGFLGLTWVDQQLRPLHLRWGGASMAPEEAVAPQARGLLAWALIRKPS